MGWRIGNALIIASLFAWLAYVWWIKQNQDKRYGQWISCLVFLLVFLLHFFFLGAK